VAKPSQRTRDSHTREKSPDADRQFEVWSKSEDVAIHFNDLIMRWRLQAVGGLAALTALAGFVVGDADTLRARYRGMVMLSALLASGWVGVAVLDLFYYRKLLTGAVSTLIDLEKKMPDVQLSTEIERQARNGARWAPWAFYVLGVLPLLGFIGWALLQLNSMTDVELDAARKRPESTLPVRHQATPAEIAPVPTDVRRIP